MKQRRLAAILGLGALGLAVFAAPGARPSAAEEKGQKALVRQGARQWSAYCSGCHNARPPSERSPGEWDTIMLHMRVRANLPAQDAEALLAYLKSP